MTIFHVFQRLNGLQWLWLLEAYLRLWAILIRIKVKQQNWLQAQFTFEDSQTEAKETQNLIALKMHESVRLAARLHFLTVECLPRAIALNAMLRCRGFDTNVVLGVKVNQCNFDADNRFIPSLASHAWVELSGSMIGEPEAVAGRFVSIGAPVDD